MFFGAVELGATADQQARVTNTGGGTLSGTASDTSTVFTLVGGTSYSLTAGQSQLLTLRFTPNTVGQRIAGVQIGSTCAVQCKGVGVAPVILACDVSLSVIDFGTVPVGQTVDRTFTLTNQSSSTMTGALTDTSSVFTVPGTSSYSLAPGQGATFIVRFASSRPGLNACVIQTGQRGCPSVTCSAVSQPVCAVTTDHLDFGLVATGSVHKQTFTIANVGPGALAGTVGTFFFLGFFGEW